jgi:hypothetical protein
MGKKPKGWKQPKKEPVDVGEEPTEEIKPALPRVEPPQQKLPEQIRLISVKQFMLGRVDSLGKAFAHVELLEHGNRIRKLPESEWKDLYQKFLTTPRG